MTDAETAQLALRALDAEAMFADPAVLQPPATDALTAAGWTIKAYITGIDAVLRLRRGDNAGPRCFYGFLAQSTSDSRMHLLVIRGTSGITEWLEDLEGEPVEHHLAGKVHAGFDGIYDSFMTLPVGGAEGPLLDGICNLMPADAFVTVIGHSLGSALATYLTLDLVRVAPHVHIAGRFFASPRTGDQDFADFFHSMVADYRAYVNPPDLVPRVPFGFGYVPLREVVNLATPLQIADQVFCHHHAFTYAAQLDPSVVPGAVSSEDAPYLGCILGRS